MRQPSVNRKFGAKSFFEPWPDFPVAAVVFLVGSFLYVWLRIEPCLEYQSYGPYFFCQWAFFEPFLSRPGGLADYAGIFLSQLNSTNWLGALVFTLVQGGVLLASLFCLDRISGRTPGFAALIPPFILLLLRNRYGVPVFPVSIGFLLALAASIACLLLPWRRPWGVAVLGGLISVLLFLVAGLWSALLFAILSSLYVIIQLRNRPAGGGCVALALVAPLLALGTGYLDWTGLVSPWPEGVNRVLAALLYASIPASAVVLPWLPQTATLPAAFKRGLWFQGAWIGRAVVLLAFLLGWGVLGLAFDQRQKFLAKIDYCASRGQYEAVLAAASQVNSLDDPAMTRLHLALYHTGRLAEDLFSFHNMIEVAPAEGIGQGCRAQSQTLFELGFVNDAEHMACEALEMEGNRPDLLRLLARISFLKDHPQAAQVFLNVLSLIPFQKEQASAAWPVVDSAMPATERAFLDQMRSRMLTNDVVHDGLPLGRLLDTLLDSNPANQMVFEYAMAYFLIDLDLEKVIEHLPLLNNFNYARIPRSYEEALLLHQQRGGAQVDLKGRTIRTETTERFRQLRETLKLLRGRTDAQAVMAAHFGDTYWYYYAVRSRERAAEGQVSVPR